MAPPGFDENLGFPDGANDFPVQEQSRSRALKLSMYPFSQSEPGSMKAIRAPTAAILIRTAPATDSGPLSERM